MVIEISLAGEDLSSPRSPALPTGLRWPLLWNSQMSQCQRSSCQLPLSRSQSSSSIIFVFPVAPGRPFLGRLPSEFNGARVRTSGICCRPSFGAKGGSSLVSSILDAAGDCPAVLPWLCLKIRTRLGLERSRVVGGKYLSARGLLGDGGLPLALGTWMAVVAV
jgi:hypothetical protein